MRFLRWLNPEIAIGLLVATIFWTAVLGWQAADSLTDKQKQECYEAAKAAGHKTEECKSLWERTTSDPVAFFTFVLSVSTIGLWIATWRAGVRQTRDMEKSIGVSDRAAREARKANDLAREIFVAEQRPWLSWGLNYPIVLKQAGRHLRLDLDIAAENVGKSPAIGVLPATRLFIVTRGEAILTVAERVYAELAAEYAAYPSGFNFTSMLPNEKMPLRSAGVVEVASLPSDKNERFQLYLALYIIYRFADTGRMATIATSYMLETQNPAKTIAPGKVGQPLVERSPLKMALFDEHPLGIPVRPIELPGRRIT